MISSKYLAGPSEKKKRFLLFSVVQLTDVVVVILKSDLHTSGFDVIITASACYLG